ncbi:hypothetical protein AK51_18050 [Serratia nematodiphila DZ0503SBS1]|nr:hypothetical protein AK51_18050 [Serratia nematodiphila DZ0503SBS1]
MQKTWNMNHRIFEGRQLDIAQLIYDGDEVKLKEKLPSVSKEELNRPVKADMTLLFWSVLNSIYDKTRQKG